MSNRDRCKKCILPANLPSVRLDERGVCTHCRDYEKNMERWAVTKEKRQREWRKLVEFAKKKNRKYDCLIPLSGGKDSIFALYACAKLYDMKCLCITFNNGYLNPHAVENIHRAMNKCDADFITFEVNRDIQSRLYRMFLVRCGSFCTVCMRGIGETVSNVSKAFNIPLVIRGLGWRVTYLSMLPEIFQGPDQWFYSKVAYKDVSIN